MFNVSYKKVGGLHFIKLGRITLMWCVTKEARAPKHVVPGFEHDAATDYVWLPVRKDRYHDR